MKRSSNREEISDFNKEIKVEPVEFNDIARIVKNWITTTRPWFIKSIDFYSCSANLELRI